MHPMHEHISFSHGSHSIGLKTAYMDEFEEDTEHALEDAVQKEPEVAKDEGELQKKLNNGEARLQPISIDDVQKLKIVKDEVCEAFYRWIPVRQRTIKKLQEIIAKLDEVHRDVNIAKTTASASGIVGSSLAIGGFVGSFFTFGATVPLMIAGAAVGGAGGVTSAGASIAEGKISRDKLKEVEEAIAKDEAESKHLEDSINNLDRVISHDMERIRRCHGTASKGQNDNAEIMKYFQQVDLKNPTFDSFVMPVGGGMYNIGSLGYAGFKTAKVIKGGVEAVPTALRTMSSLGRVASIGGAVGGLIFLPVDAHSLIKSVKHLKNKSSPELAENIRKVQNEMKCPQEWEIPDLVNSYILEKAEELVQ